MSNIDSANVMTMFGSIDCLGVVKPDSWLNSSGDILFDHKQLTHTGSLPSETYASRTYNKDIENADMYLLIRFGDDVVTHNFHLDCKIENSSEPENHHVDITIRGNEVVLTTTCGVYVYT